MADRSRSLVHEHDDAKDVELVERAKKATAGPAAPMPLLHDAEQVEGKDAAVSNDAEFAALLRRSSFSADDAKADASPAGVSEHAADAPRAENETEAKTDQQDTVTFDDEFAALLGRSSFSADDSKADDVDAPRQAGDETGHEAGEDVKTTGTGTEPTSVGEICRAVAVYWKVLTPSAGALETDELKWLGGQLTPAQWGDLEAVAATEHESLIARLEEQKLDVTDEGVLVHEVDGEQQPLPVDAGGNPVEDEKAVLIGDPEAQARAEVEVQGGKLHRAATAEEQKEPVDTTDSSTGQATRGAENIVVDDEGKIYLTDEVPGESVPDLVADDHAVMHGEIEVKDGVIALLSNRSGPAPDDDSGLRETLTLLQQGGAAVGFAVHEVSDDVRTTGSELLEDAKEAEVEAVKDVSPRTLEVLRKVPAWRTLADEVGEAELANIMAGRGWEGTGTEILDEAGEPVDPQVARSLLKHELQDLAPDRDDAKSRGPAS